MLISRSARLSNFRQFADAVCGSARGSIRHSSTIPRPTHLHQIPTLKFQDECSVSGVPTLFSPNGFTTAWTQYQNLMCTRISEHTVGQDEEGLPALAVLLKTARESSKAATFNYASMAWNNHFFFDGLWLDPITPPAPISKTLETEFSRSFSLEGGLRNEMISSAKAMFGPGFVWLVATRDISNSSLLSYQILCTYNAGTPHSGAHYRRQSADMNNRNILSGSLEVKKAQANARASRDAAPGGLRVEPLLCVNTWEHAWLQDFGMYGKEDYLDAWWNRVDWQKVEARLRGHSSSSADIGSDVTMAPSTGEHENSTW